MRPQLRTALLAACLLTGVLSAPAGADASATQIVVFDELPRDAVVRLRDAGVTHAALFPDADAAAIAGPRHAMRRVRRFGDVAALYPERRFELATFQTKMSLGIDRVHAGTAGLRSPYTGSGVTVAVFDTGIEDAHPDLDDRVAANLYFEASGVLDPITDGEYSRSNAETARGFDELQHGTLVGGIVAGTGESAAGADMRGMAPEATLVNFKMIGEATHEVPSDLISESSALAAYQWMLDHRNDPRFPGGIRVATNSWGWAEPGFEPVAFANMLRSAVDAGVAVVFAAGNSGPGPDTVSFPGRLPWIVTVGASCKAQGVWTALCPDGAGQVAEFSSRGSAVDVLAPGVDVWGAAAKLGFENTVFSPIGMLTSAGSTPPPAPGSGSPADEARNRAFYLYGPGTSFATPHVAGIVALMLQANPSLTQERIEQILRSSATDLGPAGFDPDNGFGHVDGLRAVQHAEAPAPLPPPASAPVPAPPAESASCAQVAPTRVSLAAPRIRVRCTTSATLRATLTLTRGHTRRLGLRPAKATTIATGRAMAAPGRTTNVDIRLTRRARSALRRVTRSRLRAFRPTLRITAAHVDGTRSTFTRRVALEH